MKGLPYSWFVNLEVPLGKTRFASPERMNAYGFLVDSAPTAANPDLLPVGFTSHYDSGWERQYSTLLAPPVIPGSW